MSGKDMIELVIDNPEMITQFLSIATSSLFKKIDEMKNRKKDENGLYEELKTSINNYLESKYAEFSYVKPLALQGERVKLNDIYCPLTIVSNDYYFKKDKKEIRVEKFDFEIFSQTDKILIEDDAGMGKSTLMKYMFLSYFREEISSPKGYLPIFIEVRNISKNERLEDLIKKSFFLGSTDYNPNLVEKLMEQKIIYFLDGFDEIPEEVKETSINQIIDLTNRYRSNLYILSSRKENLLDNFSNYARFKIKPLTLKEGMDLLKKYNNIHKEGYFSELIDQVRTNKEALKDFLGTPLLASLIYRAFSYKKNLPTSKVEFYSQVFDALYQEHDLSTKRGYLRKIELPKIEFTKVLSEFAFSNITSLRIEFTQSEMINSLEQLKAKLGQSYSSANLLGNFHKEVPLFRKESNSYYWSHKSMQEYFIALHISQLGSNKEELMRKMVLSPRNQQYLNIFYFLYELEPLIFKKIVLDEIVQDIEIFFSKCSDNIQRKEKMFTYEKIGLYRYGHYLTDTDRDKDIFKIRKRIEEHIETTKGIVYRYAGDTTLIRYKTTKYFPLLKVFFDKKVDIFRSEEPVKTHMEVLGSIPEKELIYFDIKHMEYVDLVQEKLQRDLEEDYILIEYSKLLKEHKDITSKLIQERSEISSILDNL
ncbi:MAG: NACHT domain-containing protein [Fusobacteriaceae bacterium]